MVVYELADEHVCMRGIKWQNTALCRGLEARIVLCCCFFFKDEVLHTAR